MQPAEATPSGIAADNAAGARVGYLQLYLRQHLRAMPQYLVYPHETWHLDRSCATTAAASALDIVLRSVLRRRKLRTKTSRHSEWRPIQPESLIPRTTQLLG
jgi:hypothetical protein